MAELYEIVIRNETSGGNSPIATEPNVDGEGSIATPITQKSSGSKQNRLVSAIVATNTIKPYVEQIANFGISQVEMTTGSPELQRKLQAASGVASTLSSITIGGVTGGWQGAAVAAAMQLIQGILQTSLNQININNQKQIESENLSLARSRAGMISNKSRGGGVV